MKVSNLPFWPPLSVHVIWPFPSIAEPNPDFSQLPSYSVVTLLLLWRWPRLTSEQCSTALSPSPHCGGADLVIISGRDGDGIWSRVHVVWENEDDTWQSGLDGRARRERDTVIREFRPTLSLGNWHIRLKGLSVTSKSKSRSSSSVVNFVARVPEQTSHAHDPWFRGKGISCPTLTTSSILARTKVSHFSQTSSILSITFSSCLDLPFQPSTYMLRLLQPDLVTARCKLLLDFSNRSRWGRRNDVFCAWWWPDDESATEDVMTVIVRNRCLHMGHLVSFFPNP